MSSVINVLCLDKFNINNIEDLKNSDNILEAVLPSTKRHLAREISTYKDIINNLEVFEKNKNNQKISLGILKIEFNLEDDDNQTEYIKNDNFEGISDRKIRYLSCLKVARNLNIKKYDINKINDKKWQQLKKLKVSNHHKDAVFKIWNNVGLTPKVANNLGLTNNRKCPFCDRNNVKTNHYVICDYAINLWNFIFSKILKNH